MNPLKQKIKKWYYVISGQAEKDALIEAVSQWFEADRIRRGIPANLQGYRAKFRRNLLGSWSTNPGFGPFPVTQWQFFEDGTALLLELAGSGDNRTRYQWRELDDFSIELLWLENETEGFSPDQPEEDEESAKWFRLTYDFKMDDETVVLFQTPENDTFKFHWCDEYLEFQGDHPKEKREEP